MEELGYWDPDSADLTPAVLDVLDHQPVKKFSGDLPVLDAHSFSRPAFSKITHLDIYWLPWERWSQLATLPHLTHMCINSAITNSSVVSKLLKECASLRVLILIVPPQKNYHDYSAGLEQSDHAMECIIALQDPRLILMDGYNWGQAMKDWKQGASGGFGLWDFGRKVCEARQCEYLRRNLLIVEQFSPLTEHFRPPFP